LNDFQIWSLVLYLPTIHIEQVTALTGDAR